MLDGHQKEMVFQSVLMFSICFFIWRKHLRKTKILCQTFQVCTAWTLKTAHYNDFICLAGPPCN